MFDREYINQLPAGDGGPDGALPLSDIVVLDFSHYIAGPLAGQVLADLGATVIKIEPPGGDRFRSYPPHDERSSDEGAAYLWANHNKLGIEIDLKQPEGRQAIQALLAKADVLIENFASGVMEKLGLGVEQVRAQFPSLIYCSISAYGEKGKFSYRSGFDSVVQAESGFASMNGYADRPGVRSSSSVMDIGTALLAANGICSVLYERSRTGSGRHIEVPLYGAGLLMTGYGSLQSLCRGASPGRNGNTSKDSCPTDVYSCADASFFLHCGNTEIFIRLVRDVLQCADLADNRDYQTAKGRFADAEHLSQRLAEEFKKYGWVDLKARLDQAKVPAGEVRDLLSALESQETRELGLVERLPHETLDWVPNLRLPVFLDGACRQQSRAAPLRGQHTEYVLREYAGYSEADLQKAKASSAFRMLHTMPET